MSQACPIFIAIYRVKHPHKRNGTLRQGRRVAPKTVTNKIQALCWYYDTVQNKGKGSKELIEMQVH